MTISRILTDNGPADRSHVWRQAYAELGITPKRTRPYRPQTKNKGQWLTIRENLDLQLQAAGATWDDVVFRRIFVRDVDAYFEAVSDPELPRYGDGRPPSTLIVVTRLSDAEFLIEIDLMAVVSP